MRAINAGGTRPSYCLIGAIKMTIINVTRPDSNTQRMHRFSKISIESDSNFLLHKITREARERVPAGLDSLSSIPQHRLDRTSDFRGGSNHSSPALARSCVVLADTNNPTPIFTVGFKPDGLHVPKVITFCRQSHQFMKRAPAGKNLPAEALPAKLQRFNW